MDSKHYLIIALIIFLMHYNCEKSPQYAFVALWSHSKTCSKPQMFDLLPKEKFEKLIQDLSNTKRTTIIFQAFNAQLGNFSLKTNREIRKPDFITVMSDPLPIILEIYSQKPFFQYYETQLNDEDNLIQDIKPDTLYIFDLETPKFAQKIIDRIPMEFENVTIIYISYNLKWSSFNGISNISSQKVKKSQFEVGFQQLNLFETFEDFTGILRKKLENSTQSLKMYHHDSANGCQNQDILLYIGKVGIVDVSTLVSTTNIEKSLISSQLRHHGNFKNLEESSGNNSNLPITYVEIITFTYSVENSSIILSMIIEGNTLSFNILIQSGYFIVDQNVNNSKQEELFLTREIVAPVGLSYFCPQVILASPETIYVFEKFQLQARFEGENDITHFAREINCIGFTTIPILMGMFVTVLCGVFLGCGLQAIMNIKVGDRLDGDKMKPLPLGIVD